MKQHDCIDTIGQVSRVPADPPYVVAANHASHQRTRLRMARIAKAQRIIDLKLNQMQRMHQLLEGVDRIDEAGAEEVAPGAVDGGARRESMLSVVIFSQVGQKLTAMLAVFALTCFAWIFFRAESLDRAFEVLGRILTGWSFSAPLVDLFGCTEDSPSQRVLRLLHSGSLSISTLSHCLPPGTARQM